MKSKLTESSQSYLLRLRKYLKPGAHANLLVAWQLGSEALALRTKTQRPGRTPKQVLAGLQPPGQPKGEIKKADFLTLTPMPAGETPRRARGDKAPLKRPDTPADRRKIHEGALPQNGRHKQKKLRESLQLQKRLRRRTHRVLAAQENERKRLSRRLQDEIAQILLGINVRLLTLKKNARSHPAGLKKEIASLQRLVLTSVESMRRLAQSLDDHR
jgi:signal transduction histidine kinase